MFQDSCDIVFLAHLGLSSRLIKMQFIHISILLNRPASMVKFAHRDAKFPGFFSRLS